MRFLTAAWRDLVVINYEVESELLAPYVPRGCELDMHDDKSFVSLVAFQFLDSALFGVLPIFTATRFEEANLRFYVRRVIDGETRRGVAFIKEVVPSRLIAKTVRALYNEPYERHPMQCEKDGDALAYRWHPGGGVCELAVRTQGELLPLEAGSHEHFILEHYWGYTAQPDGRTCEYRVEHPAWLYRRVTSCHVSPTVAAFYGDPFREALAQAPSSAFVAEGSAISVSTPRFFRADARRSHG